MKKILHIILIVCFVLLAGYSPASGKSCFKVIGDIPHLPELDPGMITTPQTGMLIFSSTDKKPMIFTGSAWETLCTNNINSVTAQEYFVVKDGIPFLPTFGDVPGGSLVSGSVYYSTVDKSVMVYNGTGWSKMIDMLTGNIDESSGFSAGIGVKTFKLPVLNSNPTPTGLTAGAFYINSVSKTIRYYDGSVWQDISCQAVVKTLPLTALTGYTALGGGDVTTNGGYPVTLTGICWSPNSDPDTLLTTKTRVLATGAGVGVFSSQLTDLLPKTTYHVRAYAVNSQGVVYGDDLVFTTPIQPPVIITLEATNIKSIFAESGGDITADGGSSVTKRGIIWSSLSDPLNDPSDIITNDGSGVGIYPSSLDRLLGLTTYYVRAYAVNSAGYAYGNLVQFATPTPVPPVLNPTLSLANIAGDSAVGTALIVNNGGALVTERGICYSTDQSTYTYIKSTTVTPTDIGTFITHLTALQQGTTYYVKGYATNSVGNGYTSETSFKTARFVGITTVKPHDPAGTIAWSGGVITDVGFSDITAMGICWSMYKNPTTDSISKTSDPVTGDGTGTYTSRMTGLLPGITYYVRAYAVNLAGTSYGNLDSITMPDYAKVLTMPSSSLYLSNATVGGNVLDDGGAAVTERGVCWSTNPNPTVSNNHTSDGSGLGLFNTYLAGLSMDVTYHYRAYAVNSVGVSYGGDSIFYINHNAPLIITLAASEITSMSANSGGDIQDGGGASITLRGIMWSTNGDPLTDPLANVITNDGSGVGIFPTKMDNLLGSTTYYVRAYAVNSFVKAYGDLKVFTTLPPILAVVMSPSFTMENVTNTTATGEFLILNNGGDPITDRGIRYTTDHVNYAYVSSNTLNKTDIGTYKTFLSGLAPNTTYYAQAYAVNNVGVALSSEASFRTTSLAILSTTKPYSITGFAAYSGGEITSTGDDIISAKGICWSRSNNPTADLVTKTSETVSGLGTGIFTSHMIGLNPGVKYYVRAYAVNSFGIAYGNLDSLFTSTTAFITTSPVTNITNTTAVGGGNISDDGHDAVYTRGVCWSTSPNPTTSDSYGSNGSGLGSYQVTLTGLLGGMKYYVRAYAINSVGTAYGNLDSLKTSPPGLPTVSTTDVINIGGTTATGRGNVINNGGAVVDERGFCWNTTGTPSLSDAYATSGQGNSTFSGGVTGLTPNTKYYFRTYATNSVGTSYGNEIIFSTFTIATIITTPASQIISTGARSGGNIVSDGGALVYSSGICWNTTGSPTIYDTGTNSGLGIGEFIHSLTGLLGSTTYYIRAYAINNAGTAYGNEVVFTTSPAVVPTLTTTVVSSGAAGTTAICGGAVSSNGGALINTEGVVWSTISGFLPDTVTVNRSVQAGLGDFNSTLTGLKPGTTYYVRAYVTNSAGTAYATNEVSVTTFDVPAITTTTPTSITNVNVTSGGTITSNGGTVVTESGLCWSTESMPTVAGEHFSNGPAFGLFTRTITELMGSTTYYLRAYALNSVGLVYGQVERCTTQPPVLATILTLQPIATSSVAANSGGNVLSHGGSMVTSRGIYWSTQENFNPDTVKYNKTSQTGYYTGAFNANLTGLTPNTVYYVKAFVDNGVGTSYGNEMSFRTPMLATLTTANATSDGPTRGVSGGVISDDGGADISSRGVVWSTVASFNPDTVVVNRTYNGGGTGTFVSRPSGLKGSTTYYILAYASNIAGTSYGNLLSFTTDPATPPNLTTREAWYVYGTSAFTGGYVSDNGGEPITTRGVVWGTDPLFRADTVVVNKTVDGAMGIGYFSTTMTGLARGTTYYVKAYARNSIGTAYGNVIRFTTLDFAKLTTMPVAPSSTRYAASGGGILTSDGGTPVTNNGVCWSINPNPTVGLYTKTTYDGWSGSNFYSSLTGLSPVTKYYVRAYVNNNQGTAYGNEVTFTTPPALATIFTTYATPTSKSTVVTGGNITANGGVPVTERGVLWSNDATFNPDTVVVNKTSDGTGSGKFNSLISNMQLSISYYIRAYAVNSAGIAYGNQITITIFPTSPVLNTLDLTQITGASAMSGGEITSDGGASVTLKGICWNTTTNPTIPADLNTADGHHTKNGSGTDTYAAMLSSLLPNTLYYVRAYAINKIGTGYGIEKTFQTNGIPTLTATSPATNVIATTATSGGEITDDGRSPILSRGICWSTYSNPTIALATKTVDNSSSTIGSFIANMKGLTPETNYYVRAYATNAVGIGYGSQVTFKTNAVVLPIVTTNPHGAVDSTQAVSGGTVIDDGGMPVNVRGVCWSRNIIPTVDVTSKINDSSGGLGTYTSTISGLSPGTKYYIRAFAINSKGTGYGELDSITTEIIRPTVSEVAVTNLNLTTGTASASIIATGGALVTDKGFYWNMTGIPPTYPTLSDNTLVLGIDTIIFQGKLMNLKPNTTYYIWAYATNSAGTRYSAIPTTFNTLSLPTVVTMTTRSVTKNTAVSGGTVVKDGGSTVLTRGVCCSTYSIPSTDSLNAVYSSGGVGAYSISLNNLKEETTYYIRAYATSALGTGYGQVDTIKTLNVPTVITLKADSVWSSGATSGGNVTYSGGGTLTVISRGVCWSTDTIPTVNLSFKTANGSGLSVYSSTLTKLKHATKYYIRAFATNSVGTGYGQIDTIITGPIVPILSTAALSSVNDSTQAGATSVTDDGGAAVTQRGLCWGIAENPTLTNSYTINGQIGVGAYTDTITNLAEGKTYYVRAYAINSAGVGYGPSTTTKSCPSSFTGIHVAGFNGAPVSKIVTYGSVSSTIGGSAQCWLTQNLGSDQQAVSATDATEASAGWYWQFNRSQGYKHDGITRTPSTSWIIGINESIQWTAANDPCNLLLALGWRIPTSTEWTKANGAPQNWTSIVDGYGSVLKLHAAGMLSNADGTLTNRSISSYYWSANQSVSTTGYYLFQQTGSSSLASIAKATAMPLRCVRDGLTFSVPVVTIVTVPDSTQTSTSAVAYASVISDGGSSVTTRGFCWNTTGSPTTANNIVPSGDGKGSFTEQLTDLAEGTTIFIRAYAVNNQGTGYSPTTYSYIICPTSFDIIHTAGLNGAPVTKTVTYHSISTAISGVPRCWLTQNLGADAQPNSVSDSREAAGGWYWQFNRQQGYKHDGTTLTPSNAYTAWNTDYSGTASWLSTNDPCNLLLGLGWRLPTSTEWTNADANDGWTNASVAYSSSLKLHMAGYLLNSTGSLQSRGNVGDYWSSSYYGSGAYSSLLRLNSTSSAMVYDYQTYAFPVRCILTSLVKSVPMVSIVSIPDSAMTATTADGTATIATDGGETVSTRGLCWSTTNKIPTTADNFIPIGSGTGIFTATIPDIQEGVTYYVRAYATNGIGTGYSPSVSTFKMCPTSFEVIHTAGLNGAPVTKTVTYHSISTSISGAPVCWLTQNLGADQQPTAVNDVTEASAGWYWQFNRPQGYKHDGSTLTPSNAYTAWNTDYSGTASWLAANDPCNLLLGLGWRLPTYTEWYNADDAPQYWLSATHAYNSVLKLHMAGYLLNSTGSLQSRGGVGDYWSSTYYGSSAYSSLLRINSTSSAMVSDYQNYAYSVRCIRDAITITIPTVCNVSIPTTGMTESTAIGSATVASDGGSTVTARGLVWNTTGNPSLSDSIITNGSGLGIFSTIIKNLDQNSTYYVRAFATNSKGTGYSPTVTSFKICPSEFRVIHTAGLNGAPVTKTVNYHSISSNISGTAKCWLTQNLGADSIPSSVSDATEVSAGWYWQFNSSQGYKNDGTTLTPSNAYTAWNINYSGTVNWSSATDPCNLLLGLGWRLPTYSEWNTADIAPQYWQKATDAYNSVLNLHMAGYLVNSSGSLSSRGNVGDYWSSSYSSSGAYSSLLRINSTSSTMVNDYQNYAYSVRCIRDAVTISIPTVSNVTIPTSTMTATTAAGTATVASSGGATITTRGLCWSTSNTTPSITDNIIPTADGLGVFTSILGGLSQNYTYYVRAYATNSKGTAYSPSVTSFKICPTSFDVIHTAGLNGAPVTKTVTYHSISTSISGAPVCWLTQNLGADQPPTSVDDASEASAGWYWQFNRSQGYKHDGTTLIPSNAYTAWATDYSGTANWSSTNDPCNLLLGLGWRLPTYTELYKADDAPQYWQKATEANNSVLNLHMAGYLVNSSGSLSSRGSVGDYWSSTYYGSSAYSSLLRINSTSSSVVYDYQNYAYSVRCIRDVVSISIPTVSNVSIPTTGMTESTAIGSATVASDGGAIVTARGLVWNTTGNPSISDNVVSDSFVAGYGLGIFSDMIQGLDQTVTYYVRAFATNSKGTGYSPTVTSFKICPSEFSVIHMAGLNGAPVTKTVNYHSISSNISGTAKCWLTQNLGADQQPTAVNDATEASAGWYWQFNRPQGYKHDGSTLTPSNAYTAWNTDYSGTPNWSSATDPCNLLLGLGWRLPTYSEWNTADIAPQYWQTATDAYNSVLNLHMAGYLVNSSGSLSSRGNVGDYWSSSYSSSGAYSSLLRINSTSSTMVNDYQNYAYSVRCIRDAVTISIPTVSNVTIPTSTMTASTAAGTSTVASSGGSTITTRGLCWSTSNTTPSITDNIIPTADGLGVFTSTLGGLSQNYTYYVRAYATNSKGTAYSPSVTSFKICPTSFDVIHTAGLNGAPVTKTVTYHSISTSISGAPVCWLTQNLGADQPPTSVDDASEASAGWYWQFNRSQGYKHDGTTLIPSNAYTAWITDYSGTANWSSTNDPCNLLLGLGWRLPTYTELYKADDAPQYWQKATEAYNSVLNLHMAGYLANSSGSLSSRGSVGDYWSSTYNSSGAYSSLLRINATSSVMANDLQNYAYSVRCIRDVVSMSIPTVSNVSVPTSGMNNTSATGSATIALDGGLTVTERGLVWNSIGTPTISDNKIETSSGTGSFTSTITGLSVGNTYYVRAYAINNNGIAYSPAITSFKICPTTFGITHTAGNNGAPETKTVIYHSISSNISGTAKCWLTQNLGADQQATSASDDTQASAGWYWQFNRSQGYAYGTSRTPSTAWNTSYSGTASWSLANDPCNMLLGVGWRLPLFSEWNNANAAPQYWQKATDAYSSVLNLHMAGYLVNSSGNLSSRGSVGDYWSSSYNSSGAYSSLLRINATSSVMANDLQNYAYSVRCIHD